jgi:hypothetical protein
MTKGKAANQAALFFWIQPLPAGQDLNQANPKKEAAR